MYYFGSSGRIDEHVHVCMHACVHNPYLGQCPAKSGLWGYNFITVKIARCTKQHIFATVLLFPFTRYKKHSL